jgi:hypothetical protein
MRKVSLLNCIVHLGRLVHTRNEIISEKSTRTQEQEGSFYTKRDLKNWCWFLANHQYPSKTSRLMESLNYLFWKMILLEKPAED